jgi:hypothetical protein
LDKAQLLNSGADLARTFCDANNLPLPPIEVYESSRWRFSSTCAYYRPERIHIAPARCSHIGTSGMAWSFPGYVIDRTPYGVIQHELGHHVDHLMSSAKGAYGGNFSEDMRRDTGEAKITNYCPNDWEWFAEMFRLFVTNSDLLRILRPRTYDALVTAGFMPVVVVPWSDVLRAAPPRTIEQAAKKCRTE